MTGLFLLLVAALWMAVAAWLARIITCKLPRKRWTFVVRVGLLLALLPMPLIDEILAERQFKQLCNENSTIQIDRSRVAGRTVYFDPLPPVEIGGTWTRIVVRPHRFIDPVSNEQLISYNTLTAGGGVLSRTLGIYEGGAPLTFNGNCHPDEDVKNLFKALHITALDRPELNIDRKLK